MSKTGDIETLFSLLDKKPSGTYQEIVVEEQIQESKRRWPIFELSDVAEHQTQSKEKKLFKQTSEEKKPLSLSPVKHTTPLSVFNKTKQTEHAENKIEPSLDWSRKLHSANEEQTTEAQPTGLSSLFSKLQKQKTPENKSLFDKLVKK